MSRAPVARRSARLSSRAAERARSRSPPTDREDRSDRARASSPATARLARLLEESPFEEGKLLRMVRHKLAWAATRIPPASVPTWAPHCVHRFLVESGGGGVLEDVAAEAERAATARARDMATLVAAARRSDTEESTGDEFSDDPSDASLLSDSDSESGDSESGDSVADSGVSTDSEDSPIPAGRRAGGRGIVWECESLEDTP